MNTYARICTCVCVCVLVHRKLTNGNVTKIKKSGFLRNQFDLEPSFRFLFYAENDNDTLRNEMF